MSDAKLSGTQEGDRIAYLGGRNVTYDLTGADPRFFCGPEGTFGPDEFVVFEANQIHSFKIPVFDNSIVVEQWDNEKMEWSRIDRDESGAKGWRTLDQDTESTAKAYLLDGTGEFTGKLVKEIQFFLLQPGAPANKIHVRVSYQRFYMDLYEHNGFDGVGPSYTPSLGQFLLDKVQDLESIMASNFANAYAVADPATDMLPEDLTGLNAKNYMVDEIHENVTTTKGVDSLMPRRGSFYSHDFRMWRYQVRTGTVQWANQRYNVDNQAIFIYVSEEQVGHTSSKLTTVKRVYLTDENYHEYIGLAGSFIDRAKMTLMRPGIDYEFANLNVAKTEKSESEYGVYDTVRILTSFTGSLLISYHAFGGAVVFEDVQFMRQDISNVLRILASKNLLTSDILDKQPIIRELLDRVQVMEQYHGHFNQVEHAVFMGTPGFHWFNIAMLYDVAWGEELGVVDEIGTFRVESKIRKWCYEFILSADLKKRLVNMMRCKTLATNDCSPSDFQNYIQYLEGRDDVAIRLCWVGNGTKSGIMLQLGWNFDHYPEHVHGVDTDTIVVTNKSGINSKWKLVYNPLDNSYEAAKDGKVYNHTKFIATSDPTYLSNKRYFWFEEIFTYYRTPSEYPRPGVQYYTFRRDPTGTVNRYEQVNLDVHKKIADYISSEYPNGIYERALYRKVPRLLENYNPGDPITNPAEVFEVSRGSFSEDDVIEMPSFQHRWVANAAECYQLRRVLEPSDGLLAWAGNVPLHDYNAKNIVLKSVLSSYIQPVLDVMTIKGITVKLYDRKIDKIVTRYGEMGYSEAAYESATGVAQDGVTYYQRTGDGSVDLPYQYFKSTIAPGEQLIEGVHFTLKSRDVAIGQVIFDLLDLCGASVNVYKDVNDRVLLDFFMYLGTDSYINKRFDLRQVEFHF